MRWRSVLAILGGLALAPGFAAAQPANTPKLGVLVPADPEPFYGAFLEGLRQRGYRPGETVHIEFRSARGQPQRLAELAEELVRLGPDILVASQTPAAQAIKQASQSIPSVVSAGDLVGTGLIASLARPGGNVTGVSSTTAELGGKSLELIREVLPRLKRVAVLANAADPFTKPFLSQIQAGGAALGIELRPAMVRRPDEFAAAFADFAKWGAQAVIIQPSLPRRDAIALANQAKLVSLSPTVAFAAEGGLMSYSSVLTDGYRALADYVDKILKGAKPADLPVQQPTRYTLIVNLKTAKAIGVELPPGLLLRADQVIE